MNVRGDCGGALLPIEEEVEKQKMDLVVGVGWYCVCVCRCHYKIEIKWQERPIFDELHPNIKNYV